MGPRCRRTFGPVGGQDGLRSQPKADTLVPRRAGLNKLQTLRVAPARAQVGTHWFRPRKRSRSSPDGMSGFSASSPCYKKVPQLLATVPRHFGGLTSALAPRQDTPCMVRLAAVLWAMMAALFAASLLVASVTVAEAHPCQQPDMAWNVASAASPTDSRTGAPCENGACHDPAGDGACCVGSCAISPAVKDELSIEIAPALTIVYGMASDAIARGRSVPPPLGPPRS